MIRLFTSESVTPGHPDKVCDQISDAILDAYLREDPNARVAAEVMASAAGIIIAGEYRSTAHVDHERVARHTLTRIGYTEASGLDPKAVPVQDVMIAQSAEIAAGVDHSFEVRDGLRDGGDELDELGAGDQGLMFGYATRETPQLMPLPIMLAHAIARQLALVRPSEGMLRPDGKTQVTVAYDSEGHPISVAGVLVSTQHAPTADRADLTRLIIRRVVSPILNTHRRMVNIDNVGILVNPSGSFVLGGPLADTGLTGRKIIVDTYGGAARHGGGAFSGKDPSKVDRSAAYAMRWVAKNVVAAGLADRCEVQVAYAIGSAQPVGLYVDTFGTGRYSDPELADAIVATFDLRPAAIIRDLRLTQPIYQQTATFGHFGVNGRPWERTTKTEALRTTLGYAGPRVA